MQSITFAISRGARELNAHGNFPNSYCVGGSYGVKTVVGKRDGVKGTLEHWTLFAQPHGRMSVL